MTNTQNSVMKKPSLQHITSDTLSASVSSPVSAITSQAFSKRVNRNNILLNLSIGQRLTLGFLAAALIAALTISGTGLYYTQSLDKQANFYESLVQGSKILLNGSRVLMLIDLKLQDTLKTARSRLSQEDLQVGLEAMRGLSAQYDNSLKEYETHHLLQWHPDQIALLIAANHATQVDLQYALFQSAMREWQLYQNAQTRVLQQIVEENIVEAEILKRIAGEPAFADALSALRSLIQFNEHLTNSVRDTTSVQQRNQIVMTFTSALLACIGIILAGGLISNTFIHRLRQIRTVTQSAKQGKLDTRLPVVGHDEITDLSLSVNAMMETMVADAIAYEQQKQLSEFKDEFIMNMSHELRTPLTQVYGFLELLVDYHGQLESEQQKIFLNRAKYGCQELMHLVNSVLDATHASSSLQTPPLQAISVGNVIREVLDHLDPRQKQDYTLNLTLPDELTVNADHQYLRQILRNLLSNAFKYSPKHTAISIYAEAITSPKSKAQVRICVQDTGPGIPPEEISQLFQRFARLKRDVSGTVRGTGLGLYVCKQLVEAMHGEIWVESNGVAGEGSRFYFTLDQAEPA